MYDAVALERGKVRADGVVRYAQRFPQILDRTTLTPQFGDDLTSCRIEKPGIEMHRLWAGT